MKTPGAFAAIDWSQPWFAPYRALGEPAAVAVAAHGSVATALNDAAALAGAAVPAATDAPVPAIPTFVAHDALPPGRAYEAHIFATGTVPTRDDLHDFFNGLVWLHFPRAKHQLNVLQAGEIARLGVGAVRGRLRDAATLFDENGAVLDAPPAVWGALAAHDWRRLFVAGREHWTRARVTVFGHALLQKLVFARKQATAHVLPSPFAIESIASTDGGIAAALDAAHLAAKPFVPLPVLGIPGWWEGNSNFAFYDDSNVFRPARALRRA